MANSQNGYLRKFLYPCSKPFTTFSKILELIKTCATGSEQYDVARLSYIRRFEDCLMQMLRPCDCKTLRVQPQMSDSFLDLFGSFTEQHNMIDAFIDKLQQLIPGKVLITPAQ